jgi:hypothetical protein
VESKQTQDILGSPGWLKLASAAEAAGLSPELFLSAVDRGEIPVRVEQFGARGLWFVHAETFRAWLAARVALPMKVSQ